MDTALKQVRKGKGISQATVADKSKTSVRTYQRYENGERVPDAYTVQLLANALGTTVEEIFPLPPDSTNLLE